MMEVLERVNAQSDDTISCSGNSFFFFLKKKNFHLSRRRLPVVGWLGQKVLVLILSTLIHGRKTALH